MPVEIPTIQPPFSKETAGKKFVLFLQQLYGLPITLFPLSIKGTANFIGFSDERSGERTISNWHKIGFLNFGDAPCLIVRQLQ